MPSKGRKPPSGARGKKKSTPAASEHSAESPGSSSLSPAKSNHDAGEVGDDTASGTDLLGGLDEDAALDFDIEMAMQGMEDGDIGGDEGLGGQGDGEDDEGTNTGMEDESQMEVDADEGAAEEEGGEEEDGEEGDDAEEGEEGEDEEEDGDEDENDDEDEDDEDEDEDDDDDEDEDGNDEDEGAAVGTAEVEDEAPVFRYAAAVDDLSQAPEEDQRFKVARFMACTVSGCKCTGLQPPKGSNVTVVWPEDAAESPELVKKWKTCGACGHAWEGSQGHMLPTGLTPDERTRRIKVVGRMEELLQVGYLVSCGK